MFISIKIRQRAATLALIATVGLTFFKLAIAMLSGSVGVLSEALHSFLDLISASLAFFTVREAGKPADWDHPFGHGKIETLSSLFESILLIVAASLMIFEGLKHLAHPYPIRYQGLAILTVFISIVVSYFVYRHNLSAARAAESNALHVNSLHFLSDVIAGAGVLAGLILLKITHWQTLDPLMAFGVAVYIILIAVTQIKKALSELVDVQLPQEEMVHIQNVLNRFQGRVIDFHDLRTRRSGSTRHIDFHMVVCGEMVVNESHAVCDEIEEEIKSVFSSASVNIHVEPCEHEQVRCIPACPRKHRK